MIKEIVVPQMDKTSTTAVITIQFAKVGTYVEEGEVICEFETDKATLEISTTFAGKLIWVAEEGAVLEVGDALAKIDVSKKEEE